MDDSDPHFVSRFCADLSALNCKTHRSGCEIFDALYWYILVFAEYPSYLSCQFKTEDDVLICTAGGSMFISRAWFEDLEATEPASQ